MRRDRRGARPRADLRALVRGGLTAGVALLAPLRPGVATPLCAAHPGPPIWGELTVEDAALTFVLHGEPEPLTRCLGLELELVGPHTSAREAELEQALAAAFADQPRVTVDGTLVPPAFVGATFPEDTPEATGWLVVDVELRFPLAQPARRVALHWERYDGTEWGGERFLPITVRHGRLPEVFSVWPAEPEFVWHAPLASLADAPPVVVPARPSTRAPRVRLPLVAFGLLALGAVLVLLWRERAASWRWGAALVCSAAAWAARGLWVVPLGGGGLTPPSELEAGAIFDRLHQGLYAAFDAKDEQSIYERLAACVAPALVDPLYGDVYESLVLREEGGAVCAIESVDVRERRVTFLPDAGSAFDVEAAWDVAGVVSHWGHLHRRRNTYRARYRVDRFEAPAAPGGGADAGAQATWKVAGIEVLEREWVDE